MRRRRSLARLARGERRDRRGRRIADRNPTQLLSRLPRVPGHMTQPISASRLAAHNVDALVALAALPLFAFSSLPLAGWFWAGAIWAPHRLPQAGRQRP